MNELTIIEKDGIQTVSARELHNGLGITDRFSRWFESLLKYGFEENQDYCCVKTSTQQNQYGGIKELDDYSISLDMAKQICMLQRSEIGKKYRAYLIELEKAWNTPEAVMARALQISTKVLLDCQKKVSLLEDKIKQDKPKVNFYNTVVASDGAKSMMEVAKLVGIGRNKLFAILRDKEILNTRNIPYQSYTGLSERP